MPPAVPPAVIHPVLSRAGLAALATLAATLGTIWPRAASAQALFGAAEVEPQRFVLVAAPIGSGPRSQLNIYEQLNNRKACFAIGEGRPAPVKPLLATFDFTGICSRYIDANGYSVRVGARDLGTVYRLMVSPSGGDTLLLALPTKSGVGPEMVVARTQGSGSGFLKFELEPGWKLMRRQFRGRSLGHVYLYSENWPVASAAPVSPGTSPPGAPPLGASPPPAAAASPEPSSPVQPLQAAPPPLPKP
jgi:hypothetical protein